MPPAKKNPPRPPITPLPITPAELHATARELMAASLELLHARKLKTGDALFVTKAQAETLCRGVYETANQFLTALNSSTLNNQKRLLLLEACTPILATMISIERLDRRSTIINGQITRAINQTLTIGRELLNAGKIYE